MMSATRAGMKWVRCAGLAAGVAVGLAWAGAGVAQQQVDNGNALDANNQVGSGGQNRVEGQVDYAARNNIITGNVAGGRAFQGSVNYALPGDFRGDLGSNSLFDFRAGSLSSSPLVSDVAGARFNGSAGAGTTAPVSVYRDFATVSRDTFGRQGVIALDGGSKGVFTGQSLSSNTRLDTLFGGSTQRVGADTLGGQTQAPPARTDLSSRITISPLLGVRQTTRPDDAVRATEVDIETPTEDSLGTPDVEVEGTPQEAGPVSSGRVTPTRVGQMAGTLNTVPSTGAPSAPPGLVIGQQMQSLVFANRAGETMDQRVARLEQMIFRATDPKIAGRGSEVYRDLLTQMREGDAEPTEGEAFDAGLAMPEDSQVEEAEAEAQSALDRAYALFGKPGEADTPGEGEDPAEGDADPMDDLLEQLRTSLPRVGSLAGDAEDQSNQLMKMAEERLADEKYFDAEALYRQARNANPDNPMAQVGLIHAQMGAGLIRSASFNLHKLFEAHPELINVRYQGKVLPPKDRLQWLQGELQRMIDSERYGGEPGIVLAYLGHQTESRQLIRYGLAVAEAKDPRDALLPVLRAVWLAPQDDDPAPAQQPEEAADPPQTPPAPEPPADAPAPALEDALNPAAPVDPEK